MSERYTVIYYGKQQVSVDFSAEPISSDAPVILLEKLEKNHQLTTNLANQFRTGSNPGIHSVVVLRKQRVYGLMGGYLRTLPIKFEKLYILTS